MCTGTQRSGLLEKMSPAANITFADESTKRPTDLETKLHSVPKHSHTQLNLLLSSLRTSCLHTHGIRAFRLPLLDPPPDRSGSTSLLDPAQKIYNRDIEAVPIS